MPFVSSYYPAKFRCVLSPTHLNQMNGCHQASAELEDMMREIRRGLGVLEKGCISKLQDNSYRGQDLDTHGVNCIKKKISESYLCFIFTFLPFVLAVAFKTLTRLKEVKIKYFELPF
ncbi:hypothetical protein XENOCAPTIV_011057 [Xenoophorus captivus]|uniref:Uncharacterized protein n=1 Tax=Xenoophorus captivus TaxID=1517983 RepID=A0ABV0RRU2_9TELE